MRRNVQCAFAAVAGVALLVSAASAAAIQSFQASGSFSLEVTGDSNLGGALPSFPGTVSLSPPPGATVHKAFVYAGDWNNSGATLDLVFDTSPNLPANPIAIDAAFQTLYGYRWDVTSFVLPGPASYNFTIGLDTFFNSQGNQIPGAALVVVWNNPAVLNSTVTINDGALQVGENTPTIVDTESMTFSGMPAGSTDLHLFTISDDAAGTNEDIKYNSVSVGGPIDENLGLGASVVSLANLTSTSPANNVVSVTSSADHFGWIASVAIVPEPASATLLLVGLPILAATTWRTARRRRRRTCQTARQSRHRPNWRANRAVHSSRCGSA